MTIYPANDTRSSLKPTKRSKITGYGLTLSWQENPRCLTRQVASIQRSSVMLVRQRPIPLLPQINSTMPFDEMDLRPLDHPGVPGEPHVGGADVVINLDIDFDYKTTERYLINNVTFQPPLFLYCFKFLSGARKASELLPNGSLFTLPPNKVVELSIPPGRGPGTPVSPIPSLLSPAVPHVSFCHLAPLASSRCKFKLHEMSTTLLTFPSAQHSFDVVRSAGVPSPITSILFVEM
jgi:hypothetical protein